ncbi:hypothetical protein FGO68_gene14581 [Halteria grandinella]|uniref:Secreted protein n=1 Tax=Halteria grandinella TaxID=5974 RepID=A0A8J8P295_HALGN|nr:hypothetical protein FGO68_gene14581 [Halteria grandinella]
MRFCCQILILLLGVYSQLQTHRGSTDCQANIYPSHGSMAERPTVKVKHSRISGGCRFKPGWGDSFYQILRPAHKFQSNTSIQNRLKETDATREASVRTQLSWQSA